MPEIWLIRHAQTEWSNVRRHTGRSDIPLTADGERVAAKLADRIDPERFDLVLSSPLKRARRTAELVGLRATAQQRAALMEWDYGEYEGLTSKEIYRQRPDWYLWRDGVPGGESPAQIGERVQPIVDEIAAVDGDVAIVAHGHLLRVLTARWLLQPVAFGGQLTLKTAAISVLGYEYKHRAILRWNIT